LNRLSGNALGVFRMLFNLIEVQLLVNGGAVGVHHFEGS
jgi:hypothetical protein